MKVRKLLVTDIRCRTCNAGPQEPCRTVDLPDVAAIMDYVNHGAHGERLAEHAELERAGWQWQEVDPTDKGTHSNRGGK